MKKEISSIKTLKYCLNCAIKSYWIIIICIFAAISTVAFHALNPIFTKEILDSITQESSFSIHKAIQMSAKYGLSFIILEFGWRLYTYVLYTKVNIQIKQNLLIENLIKILEKDFKFFQDRMSGNITAKIFAVSEGMPKIITFIFCKSLMKILQIAVFLYLLFSVNIYIGLLSSCVIALLLLCFLIFIPRLVKKSGTFYSEYSKLSGTFVDIVSNFLAVKIFSSKKREIDIAIATTNTTFSYESNMETQFSHFYTLISLVGIFLNCFSLFTMLLMREKFNNSVGDFALVFLTNANIIQMFWFLRDELGDFLNCFGKVKQALNDILSDVKIIDNENAEKLVIDNATIEFENVNFYYLEKDKCIFKNFSCLIKSGEKVGIVGESGAGKTSFMNILLRLFEIQSGKILIDGQDISKVTQNSLHKNISVIPQDTALFHRTLFENIHYGDLKKSKEEVYEAAKLASAEEFILETEKGYETLVGERGVKLSGGQRQRIAIARAFLKNAPILILDEATSALDSITEREIQKSLWKLMQNKTCIVIAHRLSTLVDMDRILVFDGGKIIEESSHKNLITQNGVYKKLWDTQNGIK